MQTRAQIRTERPEPAEGCWNARSVDVDNWGVDASGCWEAHAACRQQWWASHWQPASYSPPAIDAFGVDRQTKGTSMHCPRRDRMQVEDSSNDRRRSLSLSSCSRPILHSVKDDRRACPWARSIPRAMLHNELSSHSLILSPSSSFRACSTRNYFNRRRGREIQFSDGEEELFRSQKWRR